jgi:3-oxoadipate enol-lactonase
VTKTKVGKVELNYTVHGRGDWLVLIGGLAGGNWQSWLGQIPRLAEHYRILAFDNRGIGESDAPDEPYTTKMMAEDTIGLMDALDIRRAHVFGKSLGGAIGQVMALDHPERVRTLIMTSSFASWIPGACGSWRIGETACGIADGRNSVASCSRIFSRRST